MEGSLFHLAPSFGLGLLPPQTPDKLDRAESGSTRPLPVSSHRPRSLSLLPRLVSHQLSARTMLSDSLLLLNTRDPVFPREVPGRDHPGLHHPRVLASRSDVHQDRKIWRQKLLRARSGVLGLQQHRDVTAAGAQFRRTIHDDAVWHSGSTTHNQSFLSNMCFAYTLDTRMQQAPQRDQTSLELHQPPGAGAWLVEGTILLIFD